MTLIKKYGGQHPPNRQTARTLIKHVYAACLNLELTERFIYMFCFSFQGCAFDKDQAVDRQVNLLLRQLPNVEEAVSSCNMIDRQINIDTVPRTQMLQGAGNNVE